METLSDGPVQKLGTTPNRQSKGQMRAMPVDANNSSNSSNNYSCHHHVAQVYWSLTGHGE